MPLSKAKGNMYDWVDECYTHLGGECLHQCKYCYVKSMGERFPAIKKKHSGELRLIESEFKRNYGSGKTIFVEHMNDLFADGLPWRLVDRVLSHCNTWPDNTYVFQTKNPANYFIYEDCFLDNLLLGVTIETNREFFSISNAPKPYKRYKDFYMGEYDRRFVTVEPIMQFDLDILSNWIIDIKPEFVNIGADSKNSGLTEPTWKEVQGLINVLKENNIEVRQKSNLERLKSN